MSITKKITIRELSSIIRDMVKEELERVKNKKLVKETINVSELDPDNINPIFSRMRPADREAMVDWVMKYFFSPKKRNMPWWNKDVNKNNVLAFISHPRSQFPLSPLELLDDWSIKKSIKSDFEKIDIEDKKSMDVASPKEKTTLAKIADEIGVTIPMVQNIETKALEKLKKYFGKNPFEDGDEEMSTVLAGIDKLRKDVSIEFAKELKASKDVNDFLKKLLDKNIMTPVDLKLIKQDELEMLEYLMRQPVSEIALYLRGDALKTNNRIKTFQAAVARTLFPVTRGRPKKS